MADLAAYANTGRLATKLARHLQVVVLASNNAKSILITTIFSMNTLRSVFLGYGFAILWPKFRM
jgi:hypothetical protein